MQKRKERATSSSPAGTSSGGLILVQPGVSILGRSCSAGWFACCRSGTKFVSRRGSAVGEPCVSLVGQAAGRPPGGLGGEGCSVSCILA
jgi:hypothetical protein